LGIFVKDIFDKQMSSLKKLGAGLLKKISKKILLKRIITSFFINMQYLVNLERLERVEFYPDHIDFAIQKYTAKRAWKLGLKINNARELFTNEECCEKFCVPTLNNF
ncbi:MAG: hypothetical protein ACFFD2_00635, partial [Promethearchaeota archaeon]